MMAYNPFQGQFDKYGQGPGHSFFTYDPVSTQAPAGPSPLTALYPVSAGAPVAPPTIEPVQGGDYSPPPLGPPPTSLASLTPATSLTPRVEPQTSLTNPFGGVLSEIDSLMGNKGTTPGTFEGVGDIARGIGKVAGPLGFVSPLGMVASGLAGLSEMGSLNTALSTYGKNAGIQNAPQIGLWDAIAAGFNPFEDLRDVAQDYFFDPHGLGDVWSGDDGFDITEAPDSWSDPGLFSGPEDNYGYANDSSGGGGTGPGGSPGTGGGEEGDLGSSF